MLLMALRVQTWAAGDISVHWALCVSDFRSSSTLQSPSLSPHLLERSSGQKAFPSPSRLSPDPESLCNMQHTLPPTQAIVDFYHY